MAVILTKEDITNNIAIEHNILKLKHSITDRRRFSDKKTHYSDKTDLIIYRNVLDGVSPNNIPLLRYSTYNQLDSIDFTHSLFLLALKENQEKTVKIVEKGEPRFFSDSDQLSPNYGETVELGSEEYIKYISVPIGRDFFIKSTNNNVGIELFIQEQDNYLGINNCIINGSEEYILNSSQELTKLGSFALNYSMFTKFPLQRKHWYSIKPTIELVNYPSFDEPKLEDIKKTGKIPLEKRFYFPRV